MGNKNDGFKCDHIISKCCKKPVRFNPTSNGYSIEVWCSGCGHLLFSGRTEGLIAFWLGDFDATMKNKGYIPSFRFGEMKKVKEYIEKEVLRITGIINEKCLDPENKQYFEGKVNALSSLLTEMNGGKL